MLVVSKFLSGFYLNFLVCSLLETEPAPGPITDETRPATAAEGSHPLPTLHWSLLLMLTSVQALITTLYNWSLVTFPLIHSSLNTKGKNTDNDKVTMRHT